MASIDFSCKASNKADDQEVELFGVTIPKNSQYLVVFRKSPWEYRSLRNLGIPKEFQDEVDVSDVRTLHEYPL